MNKRINSYRLFGALGFLVLSGVAHAGQLNVDSSQTDSQGKCETPAIRNGNHYEGLGCQSQPANIVVSLKKNSDNSYTALSTDWDMCLKPNGDDTCHANDKGYAIVSVFASREDVNAHLSPEVALAFISSNTKYSASKSRTQFYLTPDEDWPTIKQNGDPGYDTFVGTPTTDGGGFTGLQTGFCNWPFPKEDGTNNGTIAQQFKVIFSVTGGDVKGGNMTANFAATEGKGCSKSNNFNE